MAKRRKTLDAAIREYVAAEGTTIEALAERADISRQALYLAIGRGFCGRDLALKLQAASGGALGLDVLLGASPPFRPGEGAAGPAT